MQVTLAGFHNAGSVLKATTDGSSAPRQGDLHGPFACENANGTRQKPLNRTFEEGRQPAPAHLRHPTSPLPLLPSGPDGICGWSSRRNRCEPPWNRGRIRGPGRVDRDDRSAGPARARKLTRGADLSKGATLCFQPLPAGRFAHRPAGENSTLAVKRTDGALTIHGEAWSAVADERHGALAQMRSAIGSNISEW